MVWIRIDDQIAHHPKFLAAGPLASWFWVCGNAYCNKYLTDGLIPESALGALGGVTGAKRLAERLVETGLWTKDAAGFHVHDFHDYNPTAAQVKQKRKDDRHRKQHGHDSTEIPSGTSVDSTEIPNGNNVESTENPERSRARVPSDPIRSDPIASTTRRAISSLESDDITERAGRLVERYGALYAEHRHGARHRQRPTLDWMDACSLVKLWPDARLDKLAVLVLTTDEAWISKTDRSFKIFALKATWADQALASWEAEQKAQQVAG